MNRLGGTALACALIVLASPSIKADILSENPYNPSWDHIERAFETAKESRDLSQVKAELRKFFESPSQDTKLLGLEWIGYRKAELREEEIDEISKFFVELNPNNSMSRGVKVEMANRHLAGASREERRAIYESAVRNGSVTLEGVEKIPRPVALGKAAADGMEEFKVLIEQYADEIDRDFPSPGHRRTDELLWMLKLRAGARDRNDAVRLHAQRLSEMEPEQFSELMSRDSAFGRITRGVLTEACQKRLSAACQDMAKVVLDQRERQEKRAAEATGKTSESTPREPDWLEGMELATAAARAKVSRERVEARMRER